MKKRSQEQAYELSFTEWLREIESSTQREHLSASQQQDMTQALMKMFQASIQARDCTSPGQEMRAIRGQAHVKRALEVAAAGRHHILLVGPVGAGKARLARTLPTLLPGCSQPHPLRELPSSCDRSAFIGNPEAPGEAILAHDGVLLMKDLDTFDPLVLTMLAQAVETHAIPIEINESWVEIPAHFLLVATLKPCPCGWSGDPAGSCRCLAQEMAQYRQRIKEMVHACFALEVEVPLIAHESGSHHTEESSAQIRKRVEAARAVQQRRYAGERQLRVNADLRSAEEVQHYCPLDSSGEELLAAAHRQLHLSPLQGRRVQAVARTIADLAGSSTIAARHLAEAIQYISRFIRDEE
jgi:magnesium chelatase family protein